MPREPVFYILVAVLLVLAIVIVLSTLFSLMN
jgi:hypothetical protein